MTRLPLHPPAEPGEALSSWIARIARVYRMSPAEFILRVASQPLSPKELDRSPIPWFSEALSEITGADPRDIDRMTLDGAIAGIQGKGVPETVGTVLIPPTMNMGFQASQQIRLSLGAPLRRVCPMCLIAPDSDFVVPLIWRTSLAHSCTTHGMLLESGDALAWRRVWRDTALYGTSPKPATAAESRHDARLQEALIGRGVAVRLGTMSASMWVAGLRQLQVELRLPGLVLQLPPATRHALGLTERDRRAAFENLSSRNVNPPGVTSDQRLSRAVANATSLIEGGSMLALGRGPFVWGIRSKTVKPRRERVQLTYSEPERLRKPDFDWGPDPEDWGVWLQQTSENSDVRARYEQHLRRFAPRSFSA